MNTRKRTGLVVTESLVIAVLPIIGSLIALAFQIGYLTYFELPADYVEITFPNVAIATVLVIAPAVFGFVCTSSLILGPSSRPHITATGRKVFIALALLTGAILVFAAVDAARGEARDAATGLTKILLFILLIGVTFEAAKRVRMWRSELSSTTAVVIWAAAFLSILGIAAYATGISYAARRTSFWVLTSNPEYALIQKASDAFVFIRLDLNENRLTPEIRLVHPNKDVPLDLAHVAFPRGIMGAERDSTWFLLRYLAGRIHSHVYDANQMLDAICTACLTNDPDTPTWLEKLRKPSPEANTSSATRTAPPSRTPPSHP